MDFEMMLTIALQERQAALAKRLVDRAVKRAVAGEATREEVNYRLERYYTMLDAVELMKEAYRDFF